VVSGGIFDSPLIATLIATALVLLVGLVLNLVSAHRRKKHHQVPAPNPAQVSAPNPAQVLAPNPDDDALSRAKVHGDDARCERP
jgi:hypothetical protein